MTVTEWTEIVDWVEDHWPLTPWTVEQAAAYFKDLSSFDAVDVWQSVMQHLASDRARFAPTDIFSRTRQIVRDAARLERKSLPPAGETGAVGWSHYSAERYGEVLTLNEAAEREHAAGSFCAVPARCTYHKETT